MLPHRQVSFFKFYQFSLSIGLLLVLFTSCITVPKKYPKNKPFVYKTNIGVSGSLPTGEKQDLLVRLQNQLDDSLKLRIISYAGIYKVLMKPPAFDTTNINRSRIYMKALLNSQGYFYPTIKDTFLVDTSDDKQKVTINFQVNPGKQTIFDSIGFDLRTPELQRLAIDNISQSVLKKGEPYSLQAIAEERERLLQVYHNNGFYKISGDDIYVERDTVIAALIDPGLDPFEQIRLLDSLRRKKDKPTITVVFKQRDTNDSTRLKKYYIGKVDVYPDQFYLQDSTQTKPDSSYAGKHKLKFFYSSNRFKLPFVANNIFLIPGTRYDERNYFRTINTFNRLGAWQSVDLNLSERFDSVPQPEKEHYAL